MTWQSGSINPSSTSPADDIGKIKNDLAVLRSVLGGTATDGDVPFRLDLINQRNDTPRPHLGIGNAAVTENKLVIVNKESVDGSGIVNAVQIQHRWDNDAGADHTGSRGALRVINMLGTAGGAARNLGTTWAVTAIADLQNNITTTESAVALSGSVFKRGQNQHAIAGHLQVRDYVVPGAPGASPSVCCEMNMSVVGPDSSTANGGFGNRHLLNLYSYTNLEVAGSSSNRAEVGAAIRIQPSNTEYTQDGGGHFRNGIVIRDLWATGSTYRVQQNALYIATGGQCAIRIKSKSSEANILLDPGDATYGEATYGLIANGTYTSGTAIRINADQHIALDATNNVRMKFNASNNRIEFYKDGTVRGYIDMTGSSHAL